METLESINYMTFAGTVSNTKYGQSQYGSYFFFTLCNYKSGTKRNGEPYEINTYVRCSVDAFRADQAQGSIHEGDVVMVNGSFGSKRRTDRQGNTVTTSDGKGVYDPCIGVTSWHTIQEAGGQMTLGQAPAQPQYAPQPNQPQYAPRQPSPQQLNQQVNQAIDDTPF